MTIISDLSFDLVDEILSRVLLTSVGAVRSTCKRWNALYKDHKFTEKHCCALVNMKYNTYDLTTGRRFMLHNIEDLPSVKDIGELRCPLKVWEVYQCGGILLCVQKYDMLVLWNPFLAQTRRIKDCYYERSCSYALGYDKNNNIKVLWISYRPESLEILKRKIYDLKSDSWRVLDSYSFRVWNCGVSLKGNTYFVQLKKWERMKVDCVLCFDFTTEALGQPMHLPFNVAIEDDVYISCIRDEHLALLFQRCRVTYEIEIWITTKIDPNAASWTKLFKVDMKPLFKPIVRSFFIDKEKKLAVVCGTCRDERRYNSAYNTSFVVGENGYYKELDLRDVFYFIPSLVPIIFSKKKKKALCL